MPISAEPGQRVAEHREQVRVAGRVHPAQRDGHAEQHQQDGQHERGDDAAGAEQQPHERLRRGPARWGCAIYPTTSQARNAVTTSHPR